MECQIISIGNELLIGDTVNTNASWLGEKLTASGMKVTHVHTVGDDLRTLKKVLQTSLSESQLVITTGGLGPTHDDVTKRAVTELFDCDLVVNEDILQFIKKTFRKRNIPFSKSNYGQAKVPSCCEVLFNTQGTAPGMWFEREGQKLAVLPGVPYEMKHLFKEKVLPKIKRDDITSRYRKSHYIITAGIGESTLSDDVIGDLSSVMHKNVSVAYLPSPQGTRIRISASGSTKEAIKECIDPVVNFIQERAGDMIIGEGRDMTLAKAVGEVLRKRELWLATAESCTGGYISNAITDVPGSSKYFKGGISAYSNKVKVKQLDVNSSTIDKNGAVSKEVALEMARGVALRMETDIGISTTGIAGPGGGSQNKPVGTVWIGFWNRAEHFALHARFTKDRLINKERSSSVALEMIRRSVLNIEQMPYGLKKHPA